MKRRLFIQGLLGGSAVLPVVAKALDKPSLGEFSDRVIKPAMEVHTMLTPEQITREALRTLNDNLQWSFPEQKILRDRGSPPFKINKI